MKPSLIVSHVRLRSRVGSQTDHQEGLPHECKAIAASLHGASVWTQTARIDVQLADRTPQAFFLETASSELGTSMLRGEYHGAKTLHSYKPGKYFSQPDINKKLTLYTTWKEYLAPSLGEHTNQTPINTST